MSETVVHHQVDAVTVYPDRARVTSVGTLDLNTGMTVLLFDDLPLSLETESVRFGGTGTARVQIQGIDVVRRHYEETPSETVGELEAQKEEVEAELWALGDERAIWQAEAAYVEGVRQQTDAFAKGLARGKTAVEDQARLLAFLQERDREVRDAQRGLEPQVRTLQRRLERIERELADLRSQRSRQRFQARIEVEVLAVGDFAAQLSYVARNASWQPLYDLRLVESKGNGRLLEVSVFGEVRQQTGQDWNDVELTLSTARPALNQRLPELEPWFVDEVEPPRELYMKATNAAFDATLLMAEALPAPSVAGAPRAKRADFVTAETRQAGPIVTYRVPRQSTVESDGAPHKNLLTRFDARPEMSYLAIPRHTTAVYRRATFVHEAAAPLLPGQANLFVDDEYVGSTNLDYTPTGDELELLLGVEERITVEQELMRRQVDKRLLRENRVLHYAYGIKLHNLLTERAKVEVQDQIPVSRHESIKIKLDHVAPRPETQTEMQILTWQLDLEPGAEHTIQVEFTIEHPRAMEVAGLLE